MEYFDNIKDLGNMIEKVRKEKEMSLEELSGKIGKSTFTLKRYEKGDIKSFDYDLFVSIAEALNVPFPYLMGWSEAKSVEIVPLPVVTRIVNGHYEFNKYRDFPSDRLPNDAGNCIFIQQKDSSMEPAIPEGSYILVEETTEIPDDSYVCGFNLDDGIPFIRMYRRNNSQSLLVPIDVMNKIYILEETNDIKILGVVREVTYSI